MSQQLTLEDKRKILPIIGVQPMLEGGPANGLRSLQTGFAGCCGSLYVSEERKKQDWLKEYDKRIWWQGGVGIPEAFKERGKESLLIPDVLGNVLVQWDDV